MGEKELVFKIKKRPDKPVAIVNKFLNISKKE